MSPRELLEAKKHNTSSIGAQEIGGSHEYKECCQLAACSLLSGEQSSRPEFCPVGVGERE